MATAAFADEDESVTEKYQCRSPGFDPTSEEHGLSRHEVRAEAFSLIMNASSSSAGNGPLNK